MVGWASNGTFGPRYELDAVELGHRAARHLLWNYEILPSLCELSP